MTLIEELLNDHRLVSHDLIDAVFGFDLATINAELTVENPFPWSDDNVTLLELAQRCACYARPWLSTLRGVDLGPMPSKAPDLHARLDDYHGRFVELCREIEDDRSWELTFIDAECEPPEVFSYGFVVKHVLAFNAHARICLASQLRQLGTDQGLGDNPRRKD